MTDTSREGSASPADKPQAGASQPGGNPAAPQPGEGTEPRSGERLGHHTSQGLSGAQGSGGGAERGIQQAPTRPNHPAANQQGGAPGAPPASSPDRDSEGTKR